MATIYIDPSANTDGNGSFETPFNTWASVTWTAGNTYLQKRNTTHQGTITVGTSGTSTNKITISAYGQGTPPVIQGLTNEHGINLGTRSYIVVENLHIVAGTGTTRNGINGLATDALTAHYITINNCIVESPTSTQGNGIQLRGRGNIIKNSTIRNCIQDGMFLTVSDCLIDNCYIHSFDLVFGGEGDGIQFAGTHDYGTTIVRNTKIIGHTKNPIKQCIITAAGSGTFRVEGGEFYGMVTGILAAVPGSVITGVKVWGNTQRGITCGANNVKIKNSLIYSTLHAISIDVVTGIEITNVTIDTLEEGITANTGAATYNIKNSYVKSGIVQTLSSSATATSNNNRYNVNSSFKINTTTYTFADWKTTTSNDAASSEITEVFLTGYSINSNSLLYQSGVFISYERDLYNNSYHNPPSIGSCEYVAERAVR